MNAIRSFLHSASGSELNEIALMVGGTNPSPPSQVRTVTQYVETPELESLRLRVKVLERTLKNCRDDIKHKPFGYNQRVNKIEELTKIIKQ